MGKAERFRESVPHHGGGDGGGGWDHHLEEEMARKHAGNEDRFKGEYEDGDLDPDRGEGPEGLLNDSNSLDDVASTDKSANSNNDGGDYNPPGPANRPPPPPGGWKAIPTTPSNTSSSPPPSAKNTKTCATSAGTDRTRSTRAMG
mmetsp:Transcript_6150/g.15330  ORF Transcript_6150/g.15330 Transcript_6150/m.15330 type:complete len:145 (+) Transcript_6150:289-723(+)